MIRVNRHPGDYRRGRLGMSVFFYVIRTCDVPYCNG